MRGIYGTLLLVLLLCVAAHSQSNLTGTIVGRAQDVSGAVVPGVEVTITSPAMIGGSRTVATDEQGVYRFELLAVGTYRVSFALPGFKTLNQDGVDVSAGMTRTINGSMEVASSSEEVTVTSQAPQIDLEQATVGVNFNQKMVSDLPWSRTTSGMYQMIPGTYTTGYDIGESSYGTALQPPRVGGRPGGAMLTFDGLAWCMTSPDFAQFEEVNIVTSAKGADQMNPGVTVNLVLKSGGNEFHGGVSLGYQNGSMQSNNIDAALLSQGFSPGSNKFTHFYTYYGNIGGPIVHNRLWFFASYQDGYNGSFIPGFVTAVGGAPAQFYTELRIPQLKLTYQLTSHQKIEIHEGFNSKSQPHRNGSALIPQDATQDQESSTTQGPTMKWTDIIDSKTTASVQLSRGGFWFPSTPYKLPEGLGPILGLTTTQPGNIVTATSQRLPTVNGVGVRITDLTTNATDGGFMTTYSRPIRWQWNADVSRMMKVAGKNTELKAGYFGWWDKAYNNTHGYPYQQMYRYRSLPGETCPGGVICSNYFMHPNSVILYDYPNYTTSGVKYKGFYVNEQITMSTKLTVNAGLRYDHVTTFLAPQGNDGSGPYATKYQIPYNGMNNLGDVYQFPVYHLWNPRLSFAYDLTGKGRVAVKGSFGQYINMDSTPNTTPGPGATSSGVNPISTRQCTYNNWNGVIPFDPTADFGKDGLMGTADDINLSAACPGSGNNGIHTFDPGLKAARMLEYTAGADFGISRNYSVRFHVSRKFDRGGFIADTGLTPFSAYTDVRCVNDPGPLANGTGGVGPVCTYSIPVTNTNRTVTNVNFINVDESTNEGQASYTAYDFTFNKEYDKGWSFLAAYDISLAHPNTMNPRTPDAMLYNSQNDLPTWNHAIKMNGIYGVPGIPLFGGKKLNGIQWSSTASMQSGDWYGRSVSVVNALGTTVNQLVQGHFGRYPWVFDWDQRISKKFAIGDRQSLEFRWDLFNSLNVNPVTAWKSTNSSASTYLQPNGTPLVPASVLTPRIYQWGASYRF